MIAGLLDDDPTIRDEIPPVSAPSSTDAVTLRKRPPPVPSSRASKRVDIDEEDTRHGPPPSAPPPAVLAEDPLDWSEDDSLTEVFVKHRRTLSSGFGIDPRASQGSLPAPNPPPRGFRSVSWLPPAVAPPVPAAPGTKPTIPPTSGVTAPYGPPTVGGSARLSSSFPPPPFVAPPPVRPPTWDTGSVSVRASSPSLSDTRQDRPSPARDAAPGTLPPVRPPPVRPEFDPGFRPPQRHLSEPPPPSRAVPVGPLPGPQAPRSVPYAPSAASRPHVEEFAGFVQPSVPRAAPVPYFGGNDDWDALGAIGSTPPPPHAAMGSAMPPPVVSTPPPPQGLSPYGGGAWDRGGFASPALAPLPAPTPPAYGAQTTGYGASAQPYAGSRPPPPAYSSAPPPAYGGGPAPMYGSGPPPGYGSGPPPAYAGGVPAPAFGARPAGLQPPATALRPGAPAKTGWNKQSLLLAAASLVLSVIMAVVLLIPRRGQLRIDATLEGGKRLERAEVFVDGRKECDTVPCRVTNLTPGAKTIKVISPDFAAPELVIETVERGKEKVVNIPLRGGKPAGGGARLKIAAGQPGLKVLVDGVEQGPPPLDLDNLAAGSHRVRFEGGARFEPTERTIEIAAGQTQEIAPVNLKVTHGRATIHLMTGGARVILARVESPRTAKLLQGPWPMALDLDPGWKVVATLRGLATFEQPVVFPDGTAEATVEIQLQPLNAAAGRPAAVAAARPAAKAPVKAPPAGEDEDEGDAPEPAAPAGQGTLNINSLPLSKVLLDGRPLGSTPKVGVPVPAGNHTVTFVHPERGRKSVTVNVKAGQTATASVRFEK
jgi:serine/threonine-protein kinase